MLDLRESLSHLEFELSIDEQHLEPDFQEVSFISEENSINLLNYDVDHIRFGRNNAYNLCLQISLLKKVDLDSFSGKKQGRLLLQSRKIIVHHQDVHYVFSGCHNTKCTITSQDQTPIIVYTFMVDKITSVYNGDEQPHVITDLFVNGSLYPLKYGNIYTYSSSISKQISQCSYISKHNLAPQFIITTIPKEYEKSYPGYLRFVYNKKFDGGIPDKKTREAISEITGFIVGKELINIGYISYSNEGEMIESVMQTPNPSSNWLSSPNSLIATPPINIILTKNGVVISKILPELIDQYLMLRDTLYLNHILSRYWTCINVRLGLNLPILQNALEILIKCKFGLSLDTNLARTTPVSRGFKGHLSKLCEELGIELSSLEGEVLKIRHAFTHSLPLADGIDQDEAEESVKTYFSYFLLFRRIFLRCLGYNGTYIDYISQGNLTEEDWYNKDIRIGSGERSESMEK